MYVCMYVCMYVYLCRRRFGSIKPWMITLDHSSYKLARNKILTNDYIINFTWVYWYVFLNFNSVLTKWVGKYIALFYADIISYPCHNFGVSLAELFHYKETRHVISAFTMGMFCVILLRHRMRKRHRWKAFSDDTRFDYLSCSMS